MEPGKVIKEESVVESPCSSPPIALVVNTSSSSSATTSSAVVGGSGGPINATSGNSPSPVIPSGKENRRVASPANSTSSSLVSVSSEILTRSRSKVLSKDNSSHHSHHNYHHHHHRHRMSESPKVGSGDRERDRDRSHDRERGSTSGPGTPTSPSPVTTAMPGVNMNSKNTIGTGALSSSSSSSSTSSSHHGNGRNHGQNFGGHAGGRGGNRTSPNDGDCRRSPSPGDINNGSPLNASLSGGRAKSTSSSGSGGGGSSSTPNFIGDSLAAHSGSSGARQIVKIKRFLGTLLHFGCDISPEVGDRVRSLVFNLVSGHLSVEEFHHSLQEVTSFPLRPFVLPFLKAHLPLLQREISQLARLNKQTPLSFIRSHEQIIIDSASNHGEPCDIFHSEAATDLVIPGKRKNSEGFYENGEPGEPGYTSTPKRHHSSLFSPPFLIAGGNGIPTALELREYYTNSVYPILASTPAASSAIAAVSSHLSHSHSRHHQQQQQQNQHESSGSTSQPGSGGTTSGSGNNSSNTGTGSTSASNTTANGIVLGNNKGGGSSEDEWKNIHVMLNCMLTMVEKTKRALSILQSRTFQGEGVDGNGNVSNWLRRPAFVVDNSEEFKRQAAEMMAQALRATEDRVAEVKRRAEEAVQELKRQALAELQRAVAAAEARACEAVANERARLERVYLESRRNSSTTGESVIVVGGTAGEAETCWNCGRKAHETCSGCNMARYCSSFCQHKDWEHHHTVCGRGSNSSSIERVVNVNGSVAAADMKNSHGGRENESPPINVSNPSPDNASSVGSNN